MKRGTLALLVLAAGMPSSPLTRLASTQIRSLAALAVRARPDLEPVEALRSVT